jgi:hypothetical protein
MMTPKSHFFRREDVVLGAVLWLTLALFIGVMIATWIASERARPVFLDLETGKAVGKKTSIETVLSGFFPARRPPRGVTP